MNALAMPNRMWDVIHLLDTLYGKLEKQKAEHDAKMRKNNARST